MGRFPGASPAPRTGCAPTGLFLHSPAPWVLCSLPCLQRTPVSADGSRVRGRTVTHAFLSPTSESSAAEAHAPPFPDGFLVLPILLAQNRRGSRGAPGGESSESSYRLLGLEGRTFYSPRGFARLRSAGQDARTRRPPACSGGVPPRLLQGSRLRPEARLGVSAGDTLCCSVSVLCDFGLRRSFQLQCSD